MFNGKIHYKTISIVIFNSYVKLPEGIPWRTVNVMRVGHHRILNGMILRYSEAVGCGEILDRCAPLSLRPVERRLVVPCCSWSQLADTIGMSGELVETETPYQIIKNLNLSLMTV